MFFSLFGSEKNAVNMRTIWRPIYVLRTVRQTDAMRRRMNIGEYLVSMEECCLQRSNHRTSSSIPQDNVVDANTESLIKVETIGDSYLCVSGLPHRNGNEHARNVAQMSFAFLKSLATFRIPHLPAERINIRIGIHTGLLLKLHMRERIANEWLTLIISFGRRVCWKARAV